MVSMMMLFVNYNVNVAIEDNEQGLAVSGGFGTQNYQTKTKVK